LCRLSIMKESLTNQITEESGYDDKLYIIIDHFLRVYEESEDYELCQILLAVQEGLTLTLKVE